MTRHEQRIRDREDLRHLHGRIDEQWGESRLVILHALEDALGEMNEFFSPE